MNQQLLTEIYRFIEQKKGYPAGSVFIPECFRDQKKWVLWKLEYNTEKGGMEKRPLKPNGRNANAANPRTWVSLETAYNAWKNDKHGVFNGIGYVLDDSGIVGIDLDHCFTESGEPTEDAKEFISKLDNQYMELSQSGSGIHIFAKGNIPRASKTGTAEFYKSDRFIACTWNVYNGHANEPSDAQQRITELFERYKSNGAGSNEGDKLFERPEKEYIADSIPDDQLLEMIRRSASGAKFIKLHDEGDYSDYIGNDGRPDHSRADQALCELYMYWTDRNAKRAAEFFRKSALYRDKWENRKDYRIRTLNAANRMCTESYTEQREKALAEGLASFKKLSADLKDYSAGPHEMLEALKEIDPAKNPKYKYVTDITLSQLFSAVIHPVARFNADEKRWYLFNGIVWETDSRDGTVVSRMAIDFQQALKQYVYFRTDLMDDNYKKAAESLSRLSKRKSIKEDAQALLRVRTADFDRRTELFNCKNGVFNTATLQFEYGHDPDLLLTKCAKVTYDPDQSAEPWEKIVNDILSKNPDCIRYLQQLIGASMIENKAHEEFYICYGPKARNGKGTIFETLGHMFGDYAKTADPDTLMEHGGNIASKASPDIARLSGCRFLKCSEPAKNSVFDVAKLKNFTGGDKKPTRKLYGEIFELAPVFRLFILSNYLPAVNDMTLFTSRRVKVIPFNNTYTEQTADITLKTRLLSEPVLSGVFNWCVQGLKDFKENNPNLKPPQSVREATEEYQKESDKLQMFIDDKLEKCPDSAVQLKDVYDEYWSWCGENGFGKESKKSFNAAVKRRGLWAATGTINGVTKKNVIKGYRIIEPGL